MNKAEVAQLLTIASMIDNRTVAPETVEAWFEVIGDLDFGIAREAMALYRRESTEYLMPAHIVSYYAIAERARKRKIRSAVTASLIPNDWPIERPIPDEIVAQSDAWFEARRPPGTEVEYEAYNAWKDSLSESELEQFYVRRGYKPDPAWRESPAALAILS